MDPHSYAKASQARTKSFDLKLRVDFETRVLSGEVTLHFVAPSQGPLDLDTRGLIIESCSVPHRLHAPDPILGARLELTLPAGAAQVTIRYRTARDASAL